MEILQGWEIITQYREGRRDFSHIRLIAADLSDVDLSDALFYNSNIENCRFASTNLTGCNFTGCYIYFSNILRANLKNAVFDSSKIEWSSFESSLFENTSMKNSWLNYVGLMNVNIGQVDLTNTSQYRVVKSLSEITEDDIIFAIKEFEKLFGSSSLEIRLSLQKRLDEWTERLKKEKTLLSRKSDTANPYEKSSASSGNYSGFSQLIDELNTYSQKNPYKAKNRYQNK